MKFRIALMDIVAKVAVDHFPLRIPRVTGAPANIRGPRPGVNPLRLAGYSQLLAEAIDGASPARISGGCHDHARHMYLRRKMWRYPALSKSPSPSNTIDSGTPHRNFHQSFTVFHAKLTVTSYFHDYRPYCLLLYSLAPATRVERPPSALPAPPVLLP
jgi:hypothetical protein